EERFRQLAENVGAVFFMFERPTEEHPGVISYVSPAYEKIWGEPCQALLKNGDSWLRTIHPEDRIRMEAGLARMAQGNFHEEFRLNRSEADIRWIQLRSFPVGNGSGEVYRV